MLPAPAVPPVISSHRALVLVVDALEESRARHFYTLTFLGFRVSETDHGHALSRARRLRPDAIVLDASDPQTNAWETARLLKSDPSTSPAFLIALADLGHEQRAKRVGVDVFVRRPCPPNVLGEMIARRGLGPARAPE